MFPLIFYLALVSSAFALPIINPSADAILMNNAFTRPMPHFNPKPSMRFCKRDGCIPTIKSWFSKLIEKIKQTWAKMFRRKPKATNPSPPNVKIQEHSNSLYEVLGVSPTASNDEINTAFRKISLASHPDKTSRLTEAEKELAKERFVKATDAKELLLNPQSRAYYDAFGTLDEIKNLDSKLTFRTVFGGSGFSDFIAVETNLGTALIQNLQTPWEIPAYNIQPDPNTVALLELRDNLERILTFSGSDEEFTIFMQSKVDSLQKESLGVPLLHSLGEGYSQALSRSVGFWKRMTTVVKLYSKLSKLQKTVGMGTATVEQRLKVQSIHWEVLWTAAEFQIFENANKVARNLLASDQSRKGIMARRLKIVSKLFQNAE